MNKNRYKTSSSKTNSFDYLRRNHYVGLRADNYSYYESQHSSASNWSTFLYFSLMVLWIEFVTKFAVDLFTFDGIIFTVLFSLPLSAFFVLCCTFSNSIKLNRRISLAITTIFSIWYCVQIVYHNVFGTFLVVTSITNGGTGQALNSVDMIMSSVLNRIVFLLLVFVPLVFNIIFGKKLVAFKKFKWSSKGILLGAAVVIWLVTLAFVNMDSSSSNTRSNSSLYHGELQQNAVCERFGLFTMQRLDISHLIFGYKTNIKTTSPQKATQASSSGKETAAKKPNSINTDFKNLESKTDNDDLKTLYGYFQSQVPSFTNKYTGMFKKYNVIFITAESFSQYAIDKKLTPTLYKMYSEGFQFNNYYSPAWGVSTTDGEYANLTGLIPKSGVWSFSQSAKSNVSFPFTLGEESHTNKYKTVNAYHNHSYDYYDRDKYLTNIGYDYKAIGKGLDLGENVWPNSDLKMMQKTTGDYINSDSFSVYYMTVSGHGGYSYNTMSSRNSDAVKNLKYSDEVKGYLASNIELDKAMKYLLDELKKAGKYNNTLICMTDDHYPYSLDDFNGLDELAGHKVDTTFERYKNAWILWSGSMKNPVKVDTYCSSLDVLPTLLNMLDFKYDSRTITGTDVFSDKQPFVVFADRSWISQNGKYNAGSGRYSKFSTAKGKDDVDELNNKCSNMFSSSRMILETNVYAQMYGDTHVVGK